MIPKNDVHEPVCGFNKKGFPLHRGYPLEDGHYNLAFKYICYDSRACFYKCHFDHTNICSYDHFKIEHNKKFYKKQMI